MRPFTIDTNWLEGGGWKNLTKHSVELGLIKLMSTGWRKCEMVKIYGNAEKLKTNKIQAITGDKCLKFLLFPVRIPAPFQVRSTKTFKQYKSNPISEYENQFLVFSMVICVA